MATGSVAKVSLVDSTNNNNNNTIIIDQKAALLKKPSRSRVDYNFFNYCSLCDLKLSKHTLRCSECRQKVRTKPWHRSKIVEFRRI
jgi:predicted amidophosphoribosyltransferase